MTEPQVVELCNASTTKPSLIFFYVFSLISLLAVYSFIPKGKKYFSLLLALFGLVSGIIGLIIYFNPNFVQGTISWIVGWFKF